MPVFLKSCISEALQACLPKLNLVLLQGMLAASQDEGVDGRLGKFRAEGLAHQVPRRRASVAMQVVGVGRVGLGDRLEEVAGEVLGLVDVTSAAWLHDVEA